MKYRWRVQVIKGRNKSKAMKDWVIKFEDVSCILLPTNSAAEAFMTDRYLGEKRTIVVSSGRSLILHQHNARNLSNQNPFLTFMFLFMRYEIMVFYGSSAPHLRSFSPSPFQLYSLLATQLVPFICHFKNRKTKAEYSRRGT